jgi:hypothetical protein
MKGVHDMERIIVLLTILAICAVFVTGALAGTQRAPDEYTVERIQRSAVTPVPKSEKVTTGKVTWKILFVEEVGPILEQSYTGSTLETKGKFITIRFKVVNHSDDLKFIYDLRLIDDKGRTYPICVAAYAYLGATEACMLAEVLPKIERSFTMSHDVPKNANDLWLEVTDLNVPPNAKMYIDLGI